MKKMTLFLMSLMLSCASMASDYKIDTKGAHAFIVFKIPHLGYSMLLGQFTKFSGDFSYDANNVEASRISVNIDTTSLNSNHAERDKHLKSDDYIDAKKYPTATFTSTQVKDLGEGKLAITGDLTLRGVTKTITIDAKKIGEGKDPWTGYRAGFSGTTTLTLADFGIPDNLGPASAAVDMELYIEGIRQNKKPKKL
ncbi:MAG: YceI family protein [Spongiibacteraceae bacterium]